jgi:hypothetical protein
VPEQYDVLISAELPNNKKFPELYKMVTKHMMHGLCGVLNPFCPCTKGRTLLSVGPHRRERTHTPFIGDAAMGVRKWLEAMSWTIIG